MPGRTTPPPGSIGQYRYGMNGQIKDGDVFEGFMSADFWGYDSRLGRRWEQDPVTKPEESPYAAFGNNPIYFADPFGLDKKDPDKKGAAPPGAPKNPEDGDIYAHKEGEMEWYYEYTDKGGWIGQGGSYSLPDIVVKPGETKTNNAVSSANKQKNNYFSTGPITYMTLPGWSIFVGDVKKVNANKKNMPIDQVIPDSRWISQMPDEGACFRTCVKILENSDIKNPAAKSKLIEITSENDGGTALRVINANVDRAIKVVDESLESGKPIIVGVNHTLGLKNNPRGKKGHQICTTDHYIIIVARTYENGVPSYYFFDVGTSHQNIGTSKDNKLRLKDNKLIGKQPFGTKHKGRAYTVSEIRPN